MPDLAEQLALDFQDGLVRIMRRYLPVIAEHAFEEASAALDIDIAFNLSNPKVQEVLDQLLSKIKKDVPETLKDEIRALIGRQADEGWGVDDLAAAIKEKAGDWSVNRAHLVAVSETATAYSRGSVLAYQESGVVEEVEWLTAGSDVCQICEPLNGRKVKIGEEFAAGIEVPGAHPACRCVILPVISEAR